jgi:hypothetical protein
MGQRHHLGAPAVAQGFAVSGQQVILGRGAAHLRLPIQQSRFHAQGIEASTSQVPSVRVPPQGPLNRLLEQRVIVQMPPDSARLHWPQVRQASS